MPYAVVDTARGLVGLASTDGKLSHTTLPKPSRGEALAALVSAGVTSLGVEDDAAFSGLPGMIRAYFRGEPVDFSGIPLYTSGLAPFHRSVVLALQRIPHGTLVTYGELARTAGSPGAARAVGNVTARNTTPIVVPCHRVIAAGGRIGGFSSGLEWKRELLKLEGVSI
jgi:methylated-DNA-[protein]-cysteine S-methyltransferase